MSAASPLVPAGLPKSGSVYQRRAPDPMGRAADNAERTHIGYGDEEMKDGARAHKRREDR